MMLAGTDIPERALIENAMKNMRPVRREQVRWMIVRDLFGIASTSAYAMCREFKLDPEEKISP